MLVLFFTIIFLAELIIASWVISKINNARKLISEYNQQVVELQPVITLGITKARTNITKTLTTLNAFVNFLTEKKGQCSCIVGKNIFSTFLSVITKLPYKQILSFLEVLIAIKKFLRK